MVRNNYLVKVIVNEVVIDSFNVEMTIEQVKALEVENEFTIELVK